MPEQLLSRTCKTIYRPELSIMTTYHVLIKGKVQGVFFRATANKIAVKNHLTGWIRNTEQGDVEAMISGEEKNCKAFIQWCHQGPEAAKVDEVIVKETAPEMFEEFSVIRAR